LSAERLAVRSRVGLQAAAPQQEVQPEEWVARSKKEWRPVATRLAGWPEEWAARSRTGRRSLSAASLLAAKLLTGPQAQVRRRLVSVAHSKMAPVPAERMKREVWSP
jgi:hypothetical protein